MLLYLQSCTLTVIYFSNRRTLISNLIYCALQHEAMLLIFSVIVTWWKKAGIAKNFITKLQTLADKLIDVK